MKVLAVLLQLVTLSLVAAAQSSWVFPLEAGNRSVYRYTEYGGGRSSILAIETVRSNEDVDGVPDTVTLVHRSGDLFAVPAWSDDWYPVRYLQATIDSAGMLWTHGRLDWRQEFPTRPPSGDTLRIVHGAGDTVLAVVSMRGRIMILDTVLVQAFTVTVMEPGRRRTLVIADGFGLVDAFDSSGSMTLINAHIRGVDWNPERRTFDYMPMCLGDVRHFSYSFINEREPWNNEHHNFADTLAMEYRVADTTYLVSSRDGTRYRSDANGVFYRDQTGIDVCAIPSHATLGTSLGIYTVSDTATVLAFGRMRRQLRLEWSDLDWASSQVWTEGLGCTFWSNWSYFTGESSETLMYYRICGEEYGTPLAAPPAPDAAAALTLDCYPNPATATGIVTVRATIARADARASVALYDLLGRRASALADGELPAGGGSLRLDTRGLAPGVYVLLLRSASGIATRRLQLLR